MFGGEVDEGMPVVERIYVGGEMSGGGRILIGGSWLENPARGHDEGRVEMAVGVGAKVWKGRKFDA